MEDDQERDRFGMEKDYEGGREIGVGFCYGKPKEKRHQTKDDCEGGSGMKKRSQESDQNSKEEYEKDDGGRPGLGLGASGSAIAGIGIGFNPWNANWGKEENANDGGGLGSGMKKRSQESDQNSKEEYEKDDGGWPGLGLGASGSAIDGIGIGFNPRNANWAKEENANDGGGGLGKNIGMGFSEYEKVDGGRPGLGLGASGSAIDGIGIGFNPRNANWAKEENANDGGGGLGKNIGMGFSEYEKVDGGQPGLGLGASGSAIAGIGIGFNLRKANWGKEENGNGGGGLGKNIGMGFSEYEEAANAAGLLEEEMKALPQPTGIQLKRKVWSKQGKLKKMKAESGEEFLVKNQQQQGINLVHNVLDMRGPKLRVLTNLDNLNAEENDRPMPEIQHNLRVLVDRAEFDMHKIDDELTKEKKNVVSLQQDLDMLKGDAALQEKQLHSMEEIVCVMDRLEEQSQLGILTLESLAESIMELQQAFPEEYKVNCLSTIACSLAKPLLDRLLQRWEPLIKPTDHLEAVSAWKGIILLQGDEICYSLYSQFFMEVVFPHVRKAITNTWKANEAEPLLQFLESWQDLLPRSAQETILDYIVMPKLTAAVNSWDPCRDTIPIHLWLHPWASWLGQRLEPLYLTIRSQLTAQGLELVLPAVRENISCLMAPEVRKFEKAKAAAQFSKFQTNSMCSKSFKEVVEHQAQCNNLLFKPKPGRMQDGHQVYWFGNMSIIIDSLNQKVFAHAEDKWSLITLEQLVKNSHGMTRR